MQATQEFQPPPRRVMDIEDYFDVARRQAAWIIGPTFAALVIAVVVAFFWPDTYISSAVIRVVPPQVPENLVPGQVQMEMSQRINEMAQTVLLSRATLGDIITTFNLYPDRRRKLPVADIVDDMAKDIKVGSVQAIQSQIGRAPMTAFEISFAYTDRLTAQKVTKELSTRFLNTNEAASIRRSMQTTGFLDYQVQKAKEELDKIESKLTTFRMQNPGSLPDQMNGNVSQLRALESQVTSNNESISHINQEKLMLDSELRTQKNQLGNLGTTPDQATTVVVNERLGQLERDIVALETRLAGLLQTYKETHPDVQSTRSQLEGLRAQRDQLLKEELAKPRTATEKRMTPQDKQTAAQMEANMARLQSRMQALDLELAQRTKDQQNLMDVIKSLQGRIQAVPANEQVYAELTRDYSLAKTNYENLNLRRSQSEIATNLEQRKQSATLELLNDASSPLTPAQPNRALIVGIGSALGILIGLSLASAREMKDTSLKSLKDVRAYSRLPVLGSVPLLETDSVVRHRKRMVWLGWSVATVAGIGAMTGSILYYFFRVRS